MIDTSTVELKCSESSSSSSSYGYRATCGQPAKMAAVDRRWDSKTQTYAVERHVPLCGKHVGAEKRKTYSKRDLVEFTPEIVAEISERLRVKREFDKKRNAEKAAQEAIRHDAYRVRRNAEAQRSFIVTRQEVERYSGTAPAWSVFESTIEPTYEEAEVRVDRSDDGFPTTLNVRISSRLDINVAKAVVEALQAAIAEAEREL